MYGSARTNLKYPGDHIIRFWNMCMRQHIPTGRVLDFGCGSGNNAKLFLDKGYRVTGTEITKSARAPCKQNGLDDLVITKSFPDRLPFADNEFDAIVSNQVLYYLGSKDRITSICNELRRVLKPDGVVCFTMMAPRDVYISKHGTKIEEDIYEVRIAGDHRLAGWHNVVYVTRDQAHLKALFNMFEPISTGYYDQSLFDIESSFHWIFVGRKH